MKLKTLLLIFGSFLGVFTATSQEEEPRKNDFCNFLLELGDGVEMNETYQMTSIKFEGIKLKHQKKIMPLLDLESLINTTVSMSFFQTNLGNICRYKKYEINLLKVVKQEVGVQLVLEYQLIPKETKSKS